MRKPVHPPAEPPAAVDAQPQLCDHCGSDQLVWVKCKLICRNCKQIVKSCADL